MDVSERTRKGSTTPSKPRKLHPGKILKNEGRHMSDRPRKKRKYNDPSPERRCGHYHPNEDQCWALKMLGYDYCYYHEPTYKEIRSENSRKGGKAPRLLPPEMPAPKMETLEEVRQFAVETLHQVRTGHLEPRTAAVVSSLVAHVLKTLPEVGTEEVSAAEKLRGLLIDDVPPRREDDEASEPMADNGPGNWKADTVHSL